MNLQKAATYLRGYRQCKLFDEIHGLLASTLNHFVEATIDSRLDLGPYALDLLLGEGLSNHISVRAAHQFVVCTLASKK